MANIEFFTLNGQKVYEMNKPVVANANNAITYAGPLRFATLVYKVTVEKNIATGVVLKPNKDENYEIDKLMEAPSSHK